MGLRWKTGLEAPDDVQGEGQEDNLVQDLEDEQHQHHIQDADKRDGAQKGQLTIHTDFAFSEKAGETVSRLTRYAVRGILVAALMLGSALLCTTAPLSPDNTAGALAFRTVGIIGFLASIYFGFRLFGKMKKGK